MAIPKTKKKIDPTDRINKALNTASAIATPGADLVADTATAKHGPQKKLGRPPLVGERKARMTFYLAQQTLERFSMAFPQEQLKRLKKGEKVDKSLVLEDILKAWLDQNGY